MELIAMDEEKLTSFLDIETDEITVDAETTTDLAEDNADVP